MIWLRLLHLHRCNPSGCCAVRMGVSHSRKGEWLTWRGRWRCCSRVVGGVDVVISRRCFDVDAEPSCSGVDHIWGPPSRPCSERCCVLKQTQQSVCGCSHVRGLLFFSVISNVFTLRSVNIGFVKSYVESWVFQVMKILFPAATAARLILFTF